jgi:hypothetical protein
MSHLISPPIKFLYATPKRLLDIITFRTLHIVASCMQNIQFFLVILGGVCYYFMSVFFFGLSAHDLRKNSEFNPPNQSGICRSIFLQLLGETRS